MIGFKGNYVTICHHYWTCYLDPPPLKNADTVKQALDDSTNAADDNEPVSSGKTRKARDAPAEEAKKERGRSPRKRS